MSKITGWNKTQSHLEKEYQLKNFDEVLSFTLKIGRVANELNHHPEMILNFKTLKVRTTTHDAGHTITEKDYQLTSAIDQELSK